MEITLNECLAGKATAIKGKEYFSTEQYVTPFLDRMSKFTDNFIINAIPANQVSLTPEGGVNTQDIVYNRVWIQAIMPDECGFDQHDRVIGMVYGLDTRKPVVKIYVGGLNRACCNLCVFDPSFLDVKELEPEVAIDYRPIDRLLSQTSNVTATLKKLSNMEVPYDEQIINESLGSWIRKTIDKQFSHDYGKIKLSASTAIDAFKLLYKDEESPYYVKPGYSTDMFNVYNAFTQCITNDKRDIINKCEKTILVSNILSI